MKCFLIKKENFYNSLVIQVKNEQSNTKKHQITIGETKIQINLLVQGKDKNNVCFDGYAKVSLRNSTVIGKLRLNISYSNINSTSLELTKNNMDKIFVITLLTQYLG